MFVFWIFLFNYVLHYERFASTDIQFFYKQAVYKQGALRWEITKQLSELNLCSLSDYGNNRLKKSGVFLL